jgi:hypothetical protein
LNLGGFHAAHVVTLLHLNSELLILAVGSNKVNMINLSKEVAPGALDVEGSVGHWSLCELREVYRVSGESEMR